MVGAIGSTGGHTPDVYENTLPQSFPCAFSDGLVSLGTNWLLRYDVQSWVAELADAGCEAITLGVEPGGDEDDVEELITLCKELDVLGVPMRYRLGLRFDRGADDWALLGSRAADPFS